MKNFSFSQFVKGSFLGILFTLFLAVSASAQTDISEKVAKLPKRDGTFLLHNDKGTRFYGIKKGGEIVEYFVIDKKGNPMAFEKTDESGNTTDEGAPQNGEPNMVGALKLCVKVWGVKICASI